MLGAQVVPQPLPGWALPVIGNQLAHTQAWHGEWLWSSWERRCWEPLWQAGSPCCSIPILQAEPLQRSRAREKRSDLLRKSARCFELAALHLLMTALAYLLKKRAGRVM